MRLKETVERFDLLYPNALPYEVKRDLLSRLEGRIAEEVTGAPANAAARLPFDENTPADTSLSAPFPHDDVYLKYLAAETDLLQGDTARYNNAVAVFNAAYEAFAAAYRRANKPEKDVRLTFPEVSACG